MVVESDNVSLSIGGLRWTNPVDAFDVNGSGDITALDALQVINQLSIRAFVIGQSDVLVDPATIAFPDRFFDTSRDGSLTALDALRVINEAARRQIGGEPELHLAYDRGRSASESAPRIKVNDESVRRKSKLKPASNWTSLQLHPLAVPFDSVPLARDYLRCDDPHEDGWRVTLIDEVMSKWSQSSIDANTA